MKKNSIIFPFALMALFLVTQLFSGCGTAPAKKDAVPVPGLTCDKEADEALKEGRYEKSIILHEFLLKKDPDNGLAMYHMGYSYGQLGEHENEVKCYEKAISLGFYGSGIFFNLGMVYGEMGRFDDSVRVFKKAIEVEPGRADNHFGLALAYQRMGLSELAEKEFKRALKLDPDDVDSNYFLGVYYAETGRRKEAEELLQKLMKIDPDNELVTSLRLLLEDKN